MSKTVNVLDALGGDLEPVLERVRLDETETAIITFTHKGEEVSIHYCEEPEICDSVLCLGTECLLCRIGKKRDERLLLPVYRPTARCIAVLPLSRSLRPRGLLPQLAPLLEQNKPSLAFILRHGHKYTVSTSDLPEDVDAGETLIQEFLTNYAAGNFELASVYPRLTNEQLASVPAIDEMARLKSINIKCT